MFTNHLPKKYTPIILVALALLMLLVAAIVAGLDSKMDFLWGNKNEVVSSTAETIDTSNWKTYRNEEYGFEFKYPADMQIINNTNIFSGVGLFDICDKNKIIHMTCEQLLGPQLRINKLNSIDVNNYQYSIDPEDRIAKEDIILAGLPGKKVIVSGSGLTLYWLQVMYRENLYTFLIPNDLGDNNEKAIEMIDKINLSFSFFK